MANVHIYLAHHGLDLLSSSQFSSITILASSDSKRAVRLWCPVINNKRCAFYWAGPVVHLDPAPSAPSPPEHLASFNTFNTFKNLHFFVILHILRLSSLEKKKKKAVLFFRATHPICLLTFLSGPSRN
jgi:hypothetical protein